MLNLWCHLRNAYYRWCKKHGPQRLTFSAWAHVRAREGKPWLRNRIDGLFLLLAGQHQHCQSQHQRETSNLTGI